MGRRGISWLSIPCAPTASFDLTEAAGDRCVVMVRYPRIDTRPVVDTPAGHESKDRAAANVPLLTRGIRVFCCSHALQIATVVFADSFNRSG